MAEYQIGVRFKICTVVESGSGINEDAALGHLSEDGLDGFLAVVDGATTLSGSHQTMCESDAQWFSNALVEALGTEYRSEHSPRSLVNAALTRLRRSRDAQAILSSDEGKPTAALALAIYSGNRITIGVLGDCAAVVEFHGGSTQAVTDARVSKLDERILKKMLSISRN